MAITQSGMAHAIQKKETSNLSKAHETRESL